MKGLAPARPSYAYIGNKVVFVPTYEDPNDVGGKRG